MKVQLLKNGLIDEQIFSSQEGWPEDVERDIREFRNTSEENRRLEKIRQLSNVVQALENVLVQCEGCEGLVDLHLSTQRGLMHVQADLRQLIHSV